MAHSIMDAKRNIRQAGQKELQAKSAGDDVRKRTLLLRSAQQLYQRALTIARGIRGNSEADDLRKKSERGFASCKKQLTAMATAQRKASRSPTGDGGPPPEDAGPSITQDGAPAGERGS